MKRPINPTSKKSGFRNGKINIFIRWKFYYKPIYVPEPVVEEKPSPPVFESYKVYFDFDKHELNMEALAILENLILNLKEKEIEEISLIGYCDFLGSNSYNMELSQIRAERVADFFRKKGINVKEIKVEGRGEINDDQPRHINRRVEIIIQN